MRTAIVSEMRLPVESQPLVIFGPPSLEYDFGPHHPLTPRRFGPGIELLRAVGAERFEPPPRASDEELRRVHTADYISTVRMLSEYPDASAMAGFSRWGDDPPFYGMHEAASAVGGGSIAAMDAILARRTLHAFHPGGGLHHAMPTRASGFCIYNDVALAIARARDAGHRVLYVDLDVHHGDGVESIFRNDTGVLTVSFHETGLALFPGTGFVEDCREPGTEGTAVNVPLQPGTSDRSWLEAVELVVPPLAQAFRPTVLISQHGCDSHAFDPLAHLRVTTAAMSGAARMLDRLSHEHTGGRWLATGGGGYDVYRVVPRVWSLVWLAQAHAEVPAETPEDWRRRWTPDAARHDQSPVPVEMLDPVGLVEPEAGVISERNLETAMAALDCSLQSLRELARG